ncbi:MAG: HAMP domain-containing histidine kinase [Deltaproteobacteria bacterium]|nr:HAMP domain-containing histidine kinase [Deltaproteobacteria bacterium]
MKYKPDSIGEAGLKFFGMISASISHELKNTLAIINESAGFLEDLTLMAEKGAAIEPLRLQSTVKRIQKQVKRADNILQNMNLFAHSVDTPVCTLDIHELMVGLLDLTRRLADMKGIKVSLQPATGPIMITTSPFFLKNLLWHVLSFAMRVAGDSKAVVMDATKSDILVRISFSHLHELSSDKTDSFPGERETALIRMLNAQFSVDDNAGRIMLTLPASSIC